MDGSSKAEKGVLSMLSIASIATFQRHLLGILDLHALNSTWTGEKVKIVFTAPLQLFLF